MVNCLKSLALRDDLSEILKWEKSFITMPEVGRIPFGILERLFVDIWKKWV